MLTRLACALGLLLLAVPALGQTVGATLAGMVVDESGAAVADVTITATNVSNGRAHAVVTGAQGHFRIVAMQPSTYRVVAARAGFVPERHELTLSVGTETNLNVTLRVAPIAATVVAETASVTASSAQSRPASLITSHEVASLPEVGRSFLTLAQLLPGSAPLNATVTRSASTKFGGVADQRSGFTTMIDGGDVDDAQWGSPTVNVTQEAVQEFKVFRYQFDAQYGQALGAVVSVVTKSGSNEARGTGFYFGRDAALNATNAFAQSRPPFDEQRFGVSAGGPLIRNRTHVIGTFESDHADTARIVALSAANPFAARENGIFPARTDERMAVARLDHRFSGGQTAFVRYLYDNQDGTRSLLNPASDSNQIDMFNRAHSILVEHDWVASPRLVNTVRGHVFHQTSGGVPHHSDRSPAIQRPAVGTGLVVGGDWQTYDRTRIAFADAAYLTWGDHDVKLGGEVALGDHTLDGHFFENGLFVFRTDSPFDAANPVTWPTSFTIQEPTRQRYQSRQFALFVQDDWRVTSRLRVNAGLRYDLDPTLRINRFYSQLLASGDVPGLEHFVTSDRGTDTNNVQPRVGASVALRADGSLRLRAGWGVYVARNRPWYQLRSMNQLAARPILVEDPARLRLYPDVAAIVAGTVPMQLGTVIPDDFVQAYAQNTSAGLAWQAGGATSLSVDYIHSYGDHQTGLTDRNLPAAGAISAANPRPVREFTQVLMLENFSRSWYDAVETEFRTRVRGVQMHASYTLSRTYLDGVDFFVTQRGTQRTPQETGFSPSDQRHNFTASATIALPAAVQVSTILKLISGSPMLVQAGFDLDGDRSPGGDRPAGLPITVGRSDTAASLQLINGLRASLTPALAPVNPALLKLDPYRSLDLRVAKSFRAGARGRVDLLIEAFNLTNHVNIIPTAVNRNINSAAFLDRRTSRDARQIQWGVRLSR